MAMMWSMTGRRGSTYEPLVASSMKSAGEGSSHSALHDAIGGGSNLDELQSILRVMPSAARSRDEHGNLPLHVAARSGSSVEVLRFLITHHPAATSKRNANGRLPFNLAAARGANSDIISELKSNLPLATNITDAIRYGQVGKVREFLSSASGEAARLSLHNAAANNASSEIITAITDANFSLASLVDEFGRLPLHCGACNSLSAEGIKALIAAFPDGSRAESNDGRLPLHHALVSDSSFEATSALLESYPRAVLKSDNAGIRPLQYAIKNRASTRVITSLVLADMPINKDGTSIPDHGYSFSYILDLKESDLSSNQCQQVVKNIMDLFSSHAHVLATSTDQRGRQNISIAHAVVREVINEFLFLCGKYEVHPGSPIHCSATAIVQLATYHQRSMNDDQHTRSQKLPFVALKFMRNFDQFQKEIIARDSAALESKYVISKLEVFDSASSPGYAVYISRKGLSHFPYCIVMPAADRSLKAIIDTERIAARDWDLIKSMCSQIIKAVCHLHAKGIIHGDLKPLNIVRVGGGELKIIDFDASVHMGEEVCAKWSSAFLPPECLAREVSETAVGGEQIIVRQPGVRGATYTTVAAHPAHDMWSIGCVFFHLFADEPLFKANGEDNLDQQNLRLLFDWGSGSPADEELRAQMLEKIVDPLGRNLVSQLLSRDPSLRPSTASHVLSHPFFTGHFVGRLPGQTAEFDVFLSYRVDSDSHIVQMLYEALMEVGVKVWWDKKCLKKGKNWEEGFCDGLVKSRCFVPLLSRNAINHPDKDWQNFAKLHVDSMCDNVFLEHTLALELRRRGLIDCIYPIFIGDYDEVQQQYGDYFRSNCGPNIDARVLVNVASVARKVNEHLSRQALGSPLLSPAESAVSSVYQGLTINQGGRIVGALDEAIRAERLAIAEMVRELSTVHPNAASDHPVSTSFTASFESSVVRVTTDATLSFISTVDDSSELLEAVCDPGDDAASPESSKLNAATRSFKRLNLKPAFSAKVLPITSDDDFAVTHQVPRSTEVHDIPSEKWVVDVSQGVPNTQLRGAAVDEWFESYLDFGEEFGGDRSAGFSGNILLLVRALLGNRASLSDILIAWVASMMSDGGLMVSPFTIIVAYGFTLVMGIAIAAFYSAMDPWFIGCLAMFGCATGCGALSLQYNWRKRHVVIAICFLLAGCWAFYLIRIFFIGDLMSYTYFAVNVVLDILMVVAVYDERYRKYTILILLGGFTSVCLSVAPFVLTGADFGGYVPFGAFIAFGAVGTPALVVFGFIVFKWKLRSAVLLAERENKKYDSIWDVVVAEESQDIIELADVWKRIMATIEHTTLLVETQQCADMSGHPASLAELFSDADKAQPILMHKAQQWAAKCRGTVYSNGVKPVARTIQKAHLSYGGHWRSLVDVARVSIIFEDVWSLRACLEIIAADRETAIMYRDARSKCRLSMDYDSKLSWGYRDLQLTVKFVRNREAYRLGVSSHLCEIQLHLRNFHDAISTVGHKNYKLMRLVFRKMSSHKLATLSKK